MASKKYTAPKMAERTLQEKDYDALWAEQWKKKSAAEKAKMAPPAKQADKKKKKPPM